MNTAVGEWDPLNVEDLERFSAEEWAKLPIEKFRKLIDGCMKHLLAVILANGYATKN